MTVMAKGHSGCEQPWWAEVLGGAQRTQPGVHFWGAERCTSVFMVKHGFVKVVVLGGEVLGGAVGVRWRCGCKYVNEVRGLGSALLKVRWRCSWGALEVQLGCVGSAVGVHWSFSWSALEVQWNFNVVSVYPIQYDSSVVSVYPIQYNSSVVSVYPIQYNSSVVLVYPIQWHFSVIPV